MVAKDTVCGMGAGEKRSPGSVYRGKAHCFCSRACKMEFDGNPGRFVKG